MKIGIQIEQRMIYQCSVTDGKIVEEEPKKFSGDWTDYVREECGYVQSVYGRHFGGPGGGLGGKSRGA